MSFPKTTGEAMVDLRWRQDIVEVMTTLHSSGP